MILFLYSLLENLAVGEILFLSAFVLCIFLLLLGVLGGWFRFWVFLFEASCNVNTSDNSESSEKKKTFGNKPESNSFLVLCSICFLFKRKLSH